MDRNSMQLVLDPLCPRPVLESKLNGQGHEVKSHNSGDGGQKFRCGV